ncbi:MAG: hypothetical protein H7315_13830 [Herminiimonas sp.]|nr:hypothetical protein [Herminiimonas sp.]
MNRVFPSLLDAVLCPPCSVITVRTIDRPVGNRLKLDHRGISSGQSSTLLGDETAGRPSDVELALILDKTQIYWI